MENQANSKSIIINYGIILGVIGVFSHLALYASGKLIELNWVNSVVGLLATVILIVLGIKKFKEANGTYLSFGQALKVGVGIAVVSGIVAIIYTQLFVNVIDPGFQDQLMEVQKQAWLDAGMNDEQIESSVEMTKKFQGPLISSGMIIVFSAFIGFIISAIAGAIMKKSAEEQY